MPSIILLGTKSPVPLPKLLLTKKKRENMTRSNFLKEFPSTMQNPQHQTEKEVRGARCRDSESRNNQVLVVFGPKVLQKREHTVFSVLLASKGKLIKGHGYNHDWRLSIPKQKASLFVVTNHQPTQRLQDRCACPCASSNLSPWSTNSP